MIELIEQLDYDLFSALSLIGLIGKPGVTEREETAIREYVDLTIAMVEPEKPKEIVAKIKLLAYVPQTKNYEPKWTKEQLDYFRTRFCSED